jgi:type IX secretion system substrate protein
MKKSLQSKLKSYSALAGAVAATGAVNAQIVYTDVTPDAVANTPLTGLNIDLDNGGVVDFIIGLNSGTSYGFPYNFVATLPQDAANAIAEDGTIATTPPTSLNAALNLSDPIDATIPWSTATQQVAAIVWPSSTSFNAGNWIGATDKYFGFKFLIGTNTHYGWARCDVSTDGATVTLKDYAYDATPNTAIPAGGMPLPTNINEALANNTMIFGFEKTIKVKLSNSSIDGIVTVVDILGQEIAKVNVTDETTTIPMDNAKSGVYFATITKADGSSFTKKLFLK